MLILDRFEMGKVQNIKELVDKFNIDKQQITKQIIFIESQRRILAQLRNNKKSVCDNSFESQEQINRLAQKIADLGNKSQSLQTEINAKSIALKEQICEVIAQLITDEMTELKRTTNQKEYEKDVYQQIERYCDTDQQIAQIEKIVSSEKKEQQIKERQCRLNEVIRKVKSNQISLAINVLEDLYENKVVFEEINIADFIPIVEEQEIIAEEEDNALVHQEELKEISNIIIKFERNDLLYKATLNNGEEINFYPTKEIAVNKKEFVSKLKQELINYVIKAHKILDNSVIKNIDINVCRLLKKVAEEHEFNYFDLVYDYAMSFSNEEGVRTIDAPIILYNLYYIKESNLNLRERARLIKASRDAEKKAKFDVMGYNIPLLRIEYFLKRIFRFNNLKEISGEKIS